MAAGALAAGTVRGRVVVEDGDLVLGSLVRATTLYGEEPMFSPIADDATYQFQNLPEGDYRFDVLDPESEPYPSASGFEEKVLVPASGIYAVTLFVRAIEEDEDPTAAAPEEASEPVEKPGKKKKVIWGTVGGVLGAIALVLLLDDDDCKDTSPSTNRGDRSSSAMSTIRRISRNGWSFGTTDMLKHFSAPGRGFFSTLLVVESDQ